MARGVLCLFQWPGINMRSRTDPEQTENRPHTHIIQNRSYGTSGPANVNIIDWLRVNIVTV